MVWVKQWDWCVFGKKKSKKRPRPDDQNAAEDEYHRPQQKVTYAYSWLVELQNLQRPQLLLLSGPPGLGKTTLAHVVARQAGYEVMEINARSVVGQFWISLGHSLLWDSVMHVQVKS
jgi:chromosome transmission fidelity protein 18